MPLYDFACKCGKVIEAVRGMDVTSIPCTVCGGDAERSSVYLVRSKIADLGVHPSIARPGDIKNRHGQYRVSLWNEAQEEVAYANERRRVRGPDLYQAGKEKAARAGATIRKKV